MSENFKSALIWLLGSTVALAVVIYHIPAVLVDGEFIPSPEIPFSDTLDELIAEIRAGRAPNLGRFCGFCSTPIREGMEI